MYLVYFQPIEWRILKSQEIDKNKRMALYIFIKQYEFKNQFLKMHLNGNLNI